VARLTIKAEAQADLRQIWWHIERDSPARADAMLDRLFERMQRCAENPGIGRIRDDLMQGLRCAVVRPYLIFYTITTDGIDVVRVMHGARDSASFFSQDSPTDPWE
jgi:toxin ParE1/3/4